MVNIYLDIDGVLLSSHRTLAKHSEEFLAFILKKYPDTTYWLTTHCKGDAMTPIHHVGYLFGIKTIELMKKIKPTNWDMLKTDGIDFTKDFLWFDDDLFEGEKKILIEHGCVDKFVHVDLNKDPEQLLKFMIK